MVDKLKDDKMILFEQLLQADMDISAAYQLAYGVSNDEAIIAVRSYCYDYLIQAGISEETALKSIYGEDIEKNKEKILILKDFN